MVWVIGNNSVQGGFGVHYWNGDQDHWTGNKWVPIDGGGVRIAVMPSGTPWIVNSAGKIFQRTVTGWQQLPGSAKDIGIGANGSVFVIGTDAVQGGSGVYRFEPNINN
jgi:hypothetical protein